MSDEPTFTVGVPLTEREGRALWEICQLLNEDPSRIGRLYLGQFPEKAVEQQHEYAHGMQSLGAAACGKLARMLEKQFGSDARGPRQFGKGARGPRLPEEGGDR